MVLYAYPYELAAHLIVSDEDAADFLQSQFSNDLRPFSPGQCTYGLWLDVKGKILADSWVLCEDEERFRIFSEHCDEQSIREKLEHHIIADDVEIESGEKMAALAAVGEEEGDLVAPLDDVLFSFPGRRSNRPSYELLFSDAAARSKWVEQNACEIVSKEWIQKERMESGLASVGFEVLSGDLPGEAGLVDSAVSLTKGCFLGQEVVARMHNVGRPQRGLYTIAGFGAPPEAPCPAANAEGKALGELRTIVPAASGWTGVAMLKSRFVECGMELALGEGRATVEANYVSRS
ncbi:hypothetical protein DDZ13_02565 [Coraliomargarita sinensis]|uniref:GCVT N-terminal domain-containing protein n=1 Tax=Coraliomargarita sinensis TaxID=2174842 RepID=A0A317ZGY4_9BACT|nr:tRNA-modifying protein YgfZ [Coraliomargarita sinensis]PXA04865.1 hypothetical protein DDZ13_02565 [Coraliomargarita sinensis]